MQTFAYLLYFYHTTKTGICQENTKKRRVASTLENGICDTPLCDSMNNALLFLLSRGEKEAKRGAFSCVLCISTSADVDKGLRPFDPCDLLKKVDQNFSTCDNPFPQETALAAAISVPIFLRKDRRRIRNAADLLSRQVCFSP